MKNMQTKLEILKANYKTKRIDYDIIYDFFEGWFAYAKQANTYKLRRKMAVEIETIFPSESSTKEINRAIKQTTYF